MEKDQINMTEENGEAVQMPRMPQPERLMRRERAHVHTPVQEEQDEMMEEAPQEQAQPAARSEGGVESIGQALRVIDMVEHKISDAKRIPMTRDKCVVSASEMADLLGQLRMVLPKAVREAHEVLVRGEQIISTATGEAGRIADEADRIYNDTVTKARQFKETIETEADAYDKATRERAQTDAQAIIADAQTSAEQIIFAAQQQAQQMVDANEITRRAQAYAMETREHAEKDADSIYTQACMHADKMLSGAAAALSRSAGELAQLRDSLLMQGQGQDVNR